MDLPVARCHLLAEILSADGLMNDAERQLLEAAMTEAGLDDAARDQIRHFEGSSEAAAALRDTPEADRMAFIDKLVEAALVDGKLSHQETAAVKRIAAALGLE